MRRAKALVLVGAFVAFALAGAAAADAWQYRHGLSLLQGGEVNEAGAAFGRIRFLKGWALPRVEALAAAAPTPEAAAPLLEALARLQPSPERWEAAVAMRRAALDPQRLRLEGGVAWGPLPSRLLPPAPPSPLPPAQLVATPTEAAPSEWGRLVRLSLRDASDQGHELGEGFEGPVGRSWAITPDAQAVWVAQDQSLERHGFSDGRVGQQLRTEGAPQFLATAPTGAPRLLFTLAGAGGDSLMLLEGSSLRSLYPGPGAAPPTWLAAAWAPDGQSVLMWWPDLPPGPPGQAAGKPPGGGVGCHVAWLRVQDGHLGMEASLEAEAVGVRPHWAIAKDGSVGLSVEDSLWVWDPKQEEAKAVPEVGRVWGFDPSGRLVASLLGQSLLVLDWRRPERQTRIALPLAAADFLPAPASLRWEGGKPEGVSVASLRGSSALSFHLGIVPLGLGQPPMVALPGGPSPSPLGRPEGASGAPMALPSSQASASGAMAPLGTSGRPEAGAQGQPEATPAAGLGPLGQPPTGLAPGPGLRRPAPGGLQPGAPQDEGAASGASGAEAQTSPAQARTQPQAARRAYGRPQRP